MNKLSHEIKSVSVPGKIILIGEHSVVYGHPALAMPLNDVRLTLTILPEEKNSWHAAWTIRMQGKKFELKEHFKNLLTESLALAVKLFGYELSKFTPQELFIDSQIPLGGGMGGSAAVAASIIKLCSQIFSKSLTLEEEIAFANQIDSLFHSGRASGLDVATILNGKLIKFQKGKSFKPIKHNCSFFIALIDSLERSETSAMIQKVAHSLVTNENAQNALKKLGELAIKCEEYLVKKNIHEFANQLNLAQMYLDDLGVSTPTLNAICHDLKQKGALCAKLTGAGGGGLVLGIFEKRPDFLYQSFAPERVFITHLN